MNTLHSITEPGSRGGVTGVEIIILSVLSPLLAELLLVDCEFGAAIRRQPQRVHPRVGVVDVGGWVGGGGEAEGVGGGVAGGFGVVVAVVVVVEGCFGVVVLAGEAEGGVGGGVGGPGGGAPEGGAGAPGDVALFVDEFGGGCRSGR